MNKLINFLLNDKYDVYVGLLILIFYSAYTIYWITTNLFTVGQNLLVKRSKKINGKVRI